MKNETKTLRTHCQGHTAGKAINQASCLQMREWILRKNKHSVSFLLAGFLSLLIIGCNQEDSQSKGEGTPMSISSLSMMAGTGTKSSTTITTDGTSLGVFRLAANGYAAQSNAKYTYSTSLSGWSATSPITLNTATASVCAYYPYGAAGITSSTDPAAVTLTSQKYDAAQDICYATNVITLSSSSPTAAFAMQHAYAQLTFTITRGSLFTGTGNITNISISNAGILSSASFKITDGTFNSTTPGVVSFNPGIASITNSIPVTASVLMVPVTSAMTGNLDLAFTVDGKMMVASLPVSIYGLMNLVAGNNYNINIQMSQSESNCYIVAPNSTISIPVSRAYAGNSANFSSSTMPWTTGLLWTDMANPLTSSGTIASITGVNTNSISGSITVTTGSATGNAVVYVMNSSNQICWSWHIWVTDYDPSITNISYNSLTWMDRNLGATDNTPGDVGCMGLYYQWGRKDPFPGPTTVDGAAEKTLYGAVTSINKTAVAASPNLVPAIQNPATFYCGTGAKYYDWYSNSSTHNDALWGFSKTVYDPCPVGWKVPANGAWPSSLTTITWLSYGATFADGWYQASGYCDGRGGAFYDVGNSGYYWSSTVNDTFAYDLAFESGSVAPSNFSNRAYGCSVRCIKE